MTDNVFTQVRIKNVPLTNYKDKEIMSLIKESLKRNRIKIVKEEQAYLYVSKSYLMNIPFTYLLYFERRGDNIDIILETQEKPLTIFGYGLCPGAVVIAQKLEKDFF